MARKKSEFDILVEDLDGRHAKRMNAILLTADDDEFPVQYMKLLEYAKPKLQRSEIIEAEKDQALKIVHVFKEKEEANE